MSNLKLVGHHDIVVEKLVQVDNCLKCGREDLVQFNSTALQCVDCDYIQSIMQPNHIRINTNKVAPAHKTIIGEGIGL
tara:strand:- start:249 stop:482 length:234 start_codon:yes stop_codon:yes gene_type:complete